MGARSLSPPWASLSPDSSEEVAPANLVGRDGGRGPQRHARSGPRADATRGALMDKSSHAAGMASQAGQARRT